MLITSPEFTSNLTGKTYYTKSLQVLFLSVFILQVVMHGEESQVPGDLRQSEILIEQDFKI
jgi:hypothetical protein